LKLHNIGYGLYFQDCNGDIEINNVDLQNLSNNGISITGGSGRRELSHITGNRISGSSGVYVSGGSRVTLTESIFDTSGQIYLTTNDSGSINISDTEIKNVSGDEAIHTYYGRNIVLERVKVENVPNGRGMSIFTTGTVQIIGSSIKNCTVSGNAGGGISLGSGSAVISNTTIEDVQSTSYAGGGIVVSSGDLTIRDSTIKNAKAPNNFGGGIFQYGSGNLVISGTTIENVEAGRNGGGIYFTAGNLTVSNSTIKNARAVWGGGISFNGSGSLVISGTTIEGVEVNYAGGGIYLVSGNFEMTNSSIKNARTTNTAPLIGIDDDDETFIIIYRGGAGIFLSGSGNAIVSGTTIEDVETASGGGGLFITGSVSLSISDTMIRNARASWGGGLVCSSDKAFVITGSRFENCRAATYGALSMRQNRSNEIINTIFLNCTARIGYKFMNTGSDTVQQIFRGCTFEDNDALYRYDPLPIDAYIDDMFGMNNFFEDCTFTNLTDNYEGEQYIFSDLGSSTLDDRLSDKFVRRYNQYSSTTLIRCTFNFRSGSAGLCAFFGGDGEAAPDYLLMDGVTINNNGVQQPLIWLHNSSRSINDTFRFKFNNVYNGTTLDTAAKITALASTGVMRLTGGARVTVVP
jgi:hypothetical protein